MATNQEMIGREDVNDLEAILSISNSDVDEVLHTVKAESDALFTWSHTDDHDVRHRIPTLDDAV